MATRSLLTNETTTRERNPVHVKRTMPNWSPIRRGFSCGRLPPVIPAIAEDRHFGSCRSPKVTLGHCWTRFPRNFPHATSRSARLFKGRFEHLRECLPSNSKLSEQRQLLIGSYFLSEFAVESAALFNPSIVADPDQQGLPSGALRFILSLRATGDGSISSIVFRHRHHPCRSPDRGHGRHWLYR